MTTLTKENCSTAGLIDPSSIYHITEGSETDS